MYPRRLVFSFLDQKGQSQSRSQALLFENIDLTEIGSLETGALSRLLQDQPPGPGLRPGLGGYLKRPRSNSEEKFSWEAVLTPSETEKTLKRLREAAAKKIEEIWEGFVEENKEKPIWPDLIQKKCFLRTLLGSIYSVQASNKDLVTRGANEFFRILSSCLAEARLSREPFGLAKLVHRLRQALSMTMVFVNIQRVLLSVQVSLKDGGSLMEIQNGMYYQEGKPNSPHICIFQCLFSFPTIS